MTSKCLQEVLHGFAELPDVRWFLIVCQFVEEGSRLECEIPFGFSDLAW